MSARVAELADRVAAFAAEREWSRFHDPKNLAMAIAAEAGELCSALRWVSSEHADVAAAEPERGDAIRQEIGDIAILLLALCNRIGVSLDELVIAKLAINAQHYPVDAARGLPERPRDAI